MLLATMRTRNPRQFLFSLSAVLPPPLTLILPLPALPESPAFLLVTLSRAVSRSETYSPRLVILHTVRFAVLLFYSVPLDESPPPAPRGCFGGSGTRLLPSSFSTVIESNVLCAGFENPKDPEPPFFWIRGRSVQSPSARVRLLPQRNDCQGDLLRYRGRKFFSMAPLPMG